MAMQISTLDIRISAVDNSFPDDSLRLGLARSGGVCWIRRGIQGLSFDRPKSQWFTFFRRVTAESLQG
jgi:hypothetical protein